MEIDFFKLDYYSDFLGENEIRFYTNSKDTKFKRNIQEFAENQFHEIQLNQGENNIYFFSLWEGYFDTLIRELIDLKKDYKKLPKFIKNWNECKGWRDVDSIEDIILENELDWLLTVIPIINENHKNKSKKSVWDNDCIKDLLIYLDFVKKNKWELRISEE